MKSAVSCIDDWTAELAQGLQALSLSLSERQQEQQVEYLDLLARWNRVYNLTAVRDPEVMVRRQLLDSLSILPWIDVGPVLDIGTGAGLPGIPLAIARPELAFSLLDSNGKKTRFVQQVVAELGLRNVEVLKSRIELLQRPQHYARITSRAFATLADMLEGSRQLLAADGRWLAMKGAAPMAELRELPPGFVADVAPLLVPGEIGSRHLVIVEHAP